MIYYYGSNDANPTRPSWFGTPVTFFAFNAAMLHAEWFQAAQNDHTSFNLGILVKPALIFCV